jgi:hypothetical protein
MRPPSLYESTRTAVHAGIAAFSEGCFYIRTEAGIARIGQGEELMSCAGSVLEAAHAHKTAPVSPAMAELANLVEESTLRRAKSLL